MKVSPLVLFAVCEMVQESLGFSAGFLSLFLGILCIQGPLKVLKENILEIEASLKTNVLNYELEVLESIYITLVTWQKNRLQLRKKS